MKDPTGLNVFMACVTQATLWNSNTGHILSCVKSQNKSVKGDSVTMLVGLL